MDKQFYVYIMANRRDGVLYTGFTGKSLKSRIFEHKQKIVAGFTAKYNVNKLVYYEIFEDAYSAISREKQIKAGSRAKKIILIETRNKVWNDLYDGL